MTERVILLSIAGLRRRDLAAMPNLARLAAAGEAADLVPSFPCLTCPVQANLTTGCLPNRHGVVANGFFWRDRRQVEMWTAGNECIEAPQIWDLLHQRRPGLTSAVWFPLHSKRAGADYICTPAPIHHPDGSESLWCYTKPAEMYGELRDALGHFPLMNYWGPLANIRSTAWIADSAVWAAQRYRPDFFYIYLPHLDYAAQKSGPDSPAAHQAAAELDAVLGRLIDGLTAAYTAAGEGPPVWLVAGEYAILPVDHVTFPNRILRQAGLLEVCNQDDGEHLDLEASRAWAQTDHQISHVFVADRSPAVIRQVAELFSLRAGIAEVLTGADLARYNLDHSRSGDVVLVSNANSWQAYYWWLTDDRAPAFARTVDIHRKPGYDPVELFFDPTTKSIPLDAKRVQGSHGVPPTEPSRQAVLLASRPGLLGRSTLADTDVAGIVLKQFGIE
jgi:hypothetical protein